MEHTTPLPNRSRRYFRIAILQSIAYNTKREKQSYAFVLLYSTTVLKLSQNTPGYSDWLSTCQACKRIKKKDLRIRTHLYSRFTGQFKSNEQIALSRQLIKLRHNLNVCQ